MHQQLITAYSVNSVSYVILVTKISLKVWTILFSNVCIKTHSHKHDTNLKFEGLRQNSVLNQIKDTVLM